jgi:NitT/TauT family transport system ATP-binding protein
VQTTLRQPALSLEGVGVRFMTERGCVTALDGIDLTLEQGSFLTVLGPSGCGKSTLLRVLADLIAPTAGTVEILGTRPSAARQRRDIGFVFQDAALLPWRSVLDNVRLPLEVGGAAPRPARRTPEELIALVGLAGWEDALPHQLSGGMRQRVSIARALVNDPRLLLMDEPFGALDEITRDRLNEELLKIWMETKTTIVFVTHSIHEAAFLSQAVLLLAARPGRIRSLVPVDFPYPRDTAMRETTEFMALLARLRGVLRSC